MAFLHNWLPTYGTHEPLHCHVAWHLALLYLQQGDSEAAHGIFNQYIRPGASQALPMFTHIDCAAFSWRSRLYGKPLSAAQQEEIETFAARHFADPGIPFVNWHTMLVLTQQDAGRAAEFAAAVREQAQRMDELPFRIGANLCAALEQFSREDYAGAADLLADELSRVPAIGGSNAQRDAIFNTWLVALYRAGTADQALEKAAERAAERAGHLDQDWFLRFSGQTP
jgi:hypothetical protein